jgi:hypothetical protein
MRATWGRVVKNEMEALSIYIFAMRLASVALCALDSTAGHRSPLQHSGSAANNGGKGWHSDGALLPPPLERTPMGVFGGTFSLDDNDDTSCPPAANEAESPVSPPSTEEVAATGLMREGLLQQLRAYLARADWCRAAFADDDAAVIDVDAVAGAGPNGSAWDNETEVICSSCMTTKISAEVILYEEARVRAGRAAALEILLCSRDQCAEKVRSAALPALPAATEVRGLYSAAMVLIEALLIPRQATDGGKKSGTGGGALDEQALAKSLALLAHRHACSFAAPY